MLGFSRELDKHESFSELLEEAEDASLEFFEALEVLYDIENAINDCCPSYVYFGAHEGDGADYGFWADTEQLQIDVGWAARHEDQPVEGYVYMEDEGIFVQTNDHGNVAVYKANRGRVGELIWKL